MTTLLDTRAVTPLQQIDYWSAGIAQHFFPIHVDQIPTHPFSARLRSGALGPIGVRSIQGPAHRVSRTESLVASADPENLLLYVMAAGSVELEQNGRQCVIQAGDIAWQDTSMPSLFEARESFEVYVLCLPKWFIGSSVKEMSELSATRVATTDSVFMRLASGFLTGSARRALEPNRMTDAEGATAAAMLLPFIRNSFLTGDAGGSAHSAQPLLAQIKNFITMHIGEPSLGPDLIAEHHYVSVRYVHKLFAASGTGVSEWIRQQRLDGARKELIDLPELSVATVAARWGYQNSTSFSRAYRQRFGFSPREFR